MKIALGYASLPARFRLVTYFLSIRLIANSTLEAMRTQGVSEEPFMSQGNALKP
jgi:hypothetical protein